MMCRKIRLSLMTVLMVGLTLGSWQIRAAETPEGRQDGRRGNELHAAMHEYYEHSLRAALGLTDEQMARVLPVVRDMEKWRTPLRDERVAAVRDLRTGLNKGASDDELQGLLDRIDRIESDEQAGEQEFVAQMDRLLTVRQRVEFRLFSERFRREMQERIQNLRQNRGNRRKSPGPAGGPPGRRR